LNNQRVGSNQNNGRLEKPAGFNNNRRVGNQNSRPTKRPQSNDEEDEEDEEGLNFDQN
jgi:hypothetical protein